MGPITLFDKSFLQTLSTDESVWFDQFFHPVIAPLFYIETLADLEKKPREGKTAEEEVGIIAAKTPQMHGAPCYFHGHLCIQDLLGRHPPMTGQIPMAGGRSVVRDGKAGAVFNEPEEAKAFARWQRGQFLEVERMYARAWRAHLARVDLSAIEKAMKVAGVTPKTCKTLEAALERANLAVEALTKSSGRFDAALTVLELPENLRRDVKDRWKRRRHPPLAIFAPYAAHVLKVEVFFQIALGANLISSDRASHQVDMAYLFYLPFCSVFVSTDTLHRTCAPLFLRADQSFVWGNDLKPDLARLNAYFAALPDEVKVQGLYKFAQRLPDESNGIIRDLFTRHTPAVLRPPVDVKPDPAGHKKLFEEVKAWETSKETLADQIPVDTEMTALVLKRQVSRKKGAWVQINPEVSDECNSDA